MRKSMMFAAMLVVCWLSPGSAQTPEPCTYAACAIRFERGFWSAKLVRGTTGAKIEGVSLNSGRLGDVFEGSDSARVHAQEYVRHWRHGNLLMLSGAVAFVSASLMLQKDNEEAWAGFTAGGMVVLVLGANDFRRATNGLERAIWWHNHDLASR